MVSKRGQGRVATVKEASDPGLLARALEKIGAAEKTSEQKRSYEKRLARFREALRRHREKRAQKTQKNTA